MASYTTAVRVDDVEFQEGPGPGRPLRLFQQTVRAGRGSEIMISDRESREHFPAGMKQDPETTDYESSHRIREKIDGPFIVLEDKRCSTF